MAFAFELNHKLRQYLTDSNIDWSVLDRCAQHAAETRWQSVYAEPLRKGCRRRMGAKAEHEYSLQSCDRFLIVPFTSFVVGIGMAQETERLIDPYECRGPSMPLGEFHDAEFFISPLDFEWTMIHTHEDYGFGGPCFVRREWAEQV